MTEGGGGKGGQAGEVSLLLEQIREGSQSATAALLPLVYDQLRAIAGGYMRRERGNHTLQPTALVHDAFVKLVAGSGDRARDRRHFLALAARAMRQVLVDHARARGAAKRGGGLQQVTLEDTLGLAATTGDDQLIDMLDLDGALTELAELSERQCRVVELRFFSGLTIAEAASVLGVSTDTVEDDWAMARGWLKRRLRESRDA